LSSAVSLPFVIVRLDADIQEAYLAAILTRLRQNRAVSHDVKRGTVDLRGFDAAGAREYFNIGGPTGLEPVLPP
jgi:hypothetical protein